MGEDIATARAERVAHLREPSSRARRELDEALAKADVAEHGAAVVCYAESLPYHHPGQDRTTYLAHPFRVGRLFLDYVGPITEEGVSTALLHNVLEVTPTAPSEIASRWGEAVADALVRLTIDRTRQNDSAYLDGYYGGIAAGPSFVGATKVLDKVDNLYTLCLNPDDDVRERYLHDIEVRLLPLARATLPAAAPLVASLVEENRRIGHRPLESFPPTPEEA